MAKRETHFLEIADLRKSFGQGEARQDVLRGVNFTVEKGEVCVLLGLQEHKYKHPNQLSGGSPRTRR